MLDTIGLRVLNQGPDCRLHWIWKPYPLGEQTNQIRGQSCCWDTVSLTQQCVQLCLDDNEQRRAGSHCAVWIGWEGCAGLTEIVVSQHRLHGEPVYTAHDDGMGRDRLF